MHKGERDRLATSHQDLEKDLHTETTAKESLERELEEEMRKSQQMDVCTYTYVNVSSQDLVWLSSLTFYYF